MAADFTFQVRQTPQTNFSYEVAEAGSSHVVPLAQSYSAGRFPEVQSHLETLHALALKVPLHFYSSLGDTFDDKTCTWTYKRAGKTIEIIDCPRTIAIIG